MALAETRPPNPRGDAHEQLVQIRHGETFEDVLRAHGADKDAIPSILQAFGLKHGDAHIIRNAGGLATDDAIRSLVISRHLLGSRITLLEGDSTDPGVVADVKRLAGTAESVLVILDSCHTREHVARELECYAPFVTKGSYIVATDGIMRDLVDVPGGMPAWKSDNPLEAATEFAARHPEFHQEQPRWLFHDGELTENVTYWPGAWLKRVH